LSSEPQLDQSALKPTAAVHDPPETAGKQRRKTPRGVLVLGLLLYAGAFVSAAAGLVVPADLLAGVPRWVLLLGALACAILATGLVRRRRWAWFATLTFVAVNAYYLLLGTATRGQNTIVGTTILAIVAGYLLWPKVRAAFLH
jgi:hypothetical protein